MIAMMSKPPKVPSIETYWGHPPPEPSARCLWWQAHVEAGWRRNRRLSQMGYYAAAEFYGVYIWEYIHVLFPLFVAQAQEQTHADPPPLP